MHLVNGPVVEFVERIILVKGFIISVDSNLESSLGQKSVQITKLNMIRF